MDCQNQDHTIILQSWYKENCAMQSNLVLLFDYLAMAYKDSDYTIMIAVVH